MFNPDIVVEMFVFDERAPEDGIEATAQGQLRDEAVGEVEGEDPSRSGQSGTGRSHS